MRLSDIDKKTVINEGRKNKPAKENLIVAPSKALVKVDHDPNEYDMEGDHTKTQLYTIHRMVRILNKMIKDDENLPEWVQSKIAKAEGMIVSVTDYLKSEKEKQSMSEDLPAGVIEDWQKVNKKDKTDGMSRKAVKAYRRENPGSKLQTAVTTKPGKLKKGSKSAKRRKSFCARMSGMKKSRASAKTKKDPNSPINKALRRWNCEDVERLEKMLENAKIKETASAGATSAASVSTLGMNPAISPGPVRGRKSYTGTPGRSGTKAPPQPKVTQPKVSSGTAKNALDMPGTNLFGGPSIKRK